MQIFRACARWKTINISISFKNQFTLNTYTIVVQFSSIIRFLFIKNDHRVNIGRLRGGSLFTAILPDPRGLQITDNWF